MNKKGGMHVLFKVQYYSSIRVKGLSVQPNFQAWTILEMVQ